MTASTTAVDRENQDATATGAPETGQTWAHPVGTGVGAATGGTVGAVIGGAVGGPVGAMVGAAVGSIAGGLAGQGIAESVNPTEEDAFWRASYSTRPYSSGRSYEDLQQAYRYGWEARARYGDRSWNEVESDLERDWAQRFGTTTRLTWNDAKPAVRDAWDRITERFGGSETGTRSGLGSAGAATTATSLAGRAGDRTGIAAEYSYEDYRPAYWYGWEAGQSQRGRSWQSVEGDLLRGWDEVKGSSRLSWPEAREAVYDAWSRASSQSPRQVPAFKVPLQELHDSTGLLHAGKIADYLHVPLKQFADALGKNYTTVHKTPSAPSLQPALQPIKRTLEILEQVLVDRAAVRAWLNSPHPDLGRRTPLSVILEGRPQVVEGMLEAALWGLPT